MYDGTHTAQTLECPAINYFHIERKKLKWPDIANKVFVCAKQG